jgi:hypothetical protein
MKYIIAKQNGLELPIIFPEIMNHAETANLLGFRQQDIVSAGFISSANTPTCHGRSESIGVESRVEDSKTIGNLLNERR